MTKDEYRELMTSILEELGYSQGYDDQGRVIASMADLENFAGRLSKLVKKDPPWKYSYMRNVLNGKLEVSELLGDALKKLAVSLDGHSPATVNLVPVQVLAPEGMVKPDSIVLVESRPCANPYCGVNFIPKIWNQNTCCPQCAKAVEQIRRGKMP